MTSSATPTSSSSTFDRLAAQGYVVLRQFLAPAECAELRAMYARLPPSVDGIGLNVRYLTLPPSIVRRVHAVLRELGAAGANVDTDARSNPFLSAEATVYGTKQARQDNKFPWHVDHGSYYFLQSHADYLNFYIPFLKEDPARSGLGVIPADALAAADPAFARRFPGGATTFYKCPDGPAPYYCRFDCEDLAHPVHCDLDAVARFPSLRAGDLLLLRMTTIHCTQDNETARLALSYRVPYPHGRVDRARAYPLSYHHWVSDASWRGMLWHHLVWFALRPRGAALRDVYPGWCEGESLARRATSNADRAVLCAWAPLFALSLALRWARLYAKRCVTNAFLFGGSGRPRHVALQKMKVERRWWWAFFPVYLAIVGRM